MTVKVVPLPTCVTRVTPNGWRWFCWRCGTAAPRPVAQDRAIKALDRHVNRNHGPIGYDPLTPPLCRP